MGELTIYDSQGSEYGSSGVERSSERIKNFFFGGVRLYASVDSQPELVVFFRARESDVGRSEQYYAVYRTRSANRLFDSFYSELRQRVESEHGMTIETASDDVAVFEALESGATGGTLPGTEFEHDVLSQLMKQGKRLRFGVPSTDEAVSLFSEYVTGPANSVAIAENTDIDELSNCDLRIETGTYRGLEPLGETNQYMNDGRRQQENRFVQNKVDSIKRDVTEIRRRTDASDREIRTKLKREVPVLESPTTQPASGSSSGRLGGLLGGLSRPQRVVLGGVGTVAVVILLLLVGMNTAAFLGHGVGGSVPYGDAVVLVGDDSTDEDLIENVAIDNQSVEDREPLDSDAVTITGETSQTSVFANLTVGESHNNTTEEVTDSEFELNLSLDDLENGNGTLTVTVGDDPPDESAATGTWNVTVERDEAADEDDTLFESTVLWPTVLDEETGDPVAGAHVTVNSGDFEDQTGPNGRVLFDNLEAGGLEPGEYNISVETEAGEADETIELEEGDDGAIELEVPTPDEETEEGNGENGDGEADEEPSDDGDDGNESDEDTGNDENGGAASLSRTVVAGAQR